MIIYKATNKENEMEYVGATIKSLSQRKSRHIHDSFYKKTKCCFHRAIKKHGKENFDWEILHRCDNKEYLEKLEMYYIGLYDTYENGYNEKLGGDKSNIGYKHTEKAFKKMIESSSRAVIIGDKYFNSRKEAAKFIGVSPPTIRYRILHKTKWLGYKYKKLESV